MAGSKSSDITSKHNEPLQEGDKVSTKFRGGHREGEIEQLVTTKEEAEQVEGVTVKNPPKVVFTDQHGRKVSHNPETLEKK